MHPDEPYFVGVEEPKQEDPKPEDMTMIWTLSIICITIIVCLLILAWTAVQIWGH